MINSNFLGRATFFAATLSLGLLASCQKDEERLTNTDVQDVTAEAFTESYFDDMSDLGLAAAEDQSSPSSGGRISEDDRWCTALSISPNSNDKAGVITIDFGTGCEDDKGNVRTGKLILTYSNGPVLSTGFTVVITTNNYTINGVKLEGTKTLTKLESAQGFIRHQITLANGKATWPDQTVITRESSFERKVDLTAQTVSLDGSASGTNRNQKSYTMNILETLVFKRACVISTGIYMPVSGKKKFTSDKREMFVDYGNGECDSQVNVQIGNYTRAISVK